MFIVADPNQIKKEGCKYLAQANWKQLRSINVSIQINIQHFVELEVEVVNILLGLIGNSYRN